MMKAATAGPSGSVVSSTAHVHRLKRLKTGDIFTFRKGYCSFCRRELSAKDIIYRCSDCDFNLCEGCQFGDTRSDFHHHTLKPANSWVIYPHTNGDWRCDGCQRVFDPTDTDRWTRHCEKCLVDLCDVCFSTGWKHGLHPAHRLFPADARLVHRRMEVWFCDNCGEERYVRSSDVQKTFHCSTCPGQGIDVCPSCFAGLKYWHHQHNLVPVINLQPKRQFVCSMCQRNADRFDKYNVHVCVQGDCEFALCGHCVRQNPPVHPLHPHPLHCCDSSTVYPNSDGLWHCNNCTESDPLRRSITRSPAEPMYHCSLCEFDLCQNCYESHAPSGSLPTMPQRTSVIQHLSSPSDDMYPRDAVSPSLVSQDSYQEKSLLVGGSGAMAVPWRSMPSMQYQPEHGYRMLNQQPNSHMVVGFRSRPRP